MTKEFDEDEESTGKQCPKCGYPTVLESGLEVCYYCGWYEGCEEQEIDR